MELQFPSNFALDSETLRPIPLLNILFERGGMGDTVARLPAVRYISQQYKHIKQIRLFVQDYFVATAKYLLISNFCTNVEVYGLTQLEEVIKNDPPDTPGVRTNGPNNPHTTLRTHLTDHAFHVLVDEQVDDEHKQYLRMGRGLKRMYSDLSPYSYAVVTTGFTAANREFLPAQVNAVASYIKSLGFEVVFLGQKQNTFREGVDPTEAKFRDDAIDFSIGLDLRDSTTPWEAMAIIGNAEFVIGVDNGLLQLAGCTDTPIVAGFTSVDPRHRTPRRNGRGESKIYTVVPKELACAFCQTSGGFVYDMDWRSCYYGNYACVSSLKLEDWISQINAALLGGRAGVIGYG